MQRSPPRPAASESAPPGRGGARAAAGLLLAASLWLAPAAAQPPAPAESGQASAQASSGQAAGAAAPGAAAESTAQELVDRMRFCASDREDRSRLLCFEAIAGGAGIEIAREGDSGAYAWVVQEGRTEDGAPDITATLYAADASLDSSPLQRPRAALVLRCRRLETQLFLMFDRPVVGKTVNLVLKLDGRPPATALWDASTTGSSAGLWIGSKSVPYSKLLMNAKQVVAQVPLRGGRITAVFEVAGMRKAIAPVQSACRW